MRLIQGPVVKRHQTNRAVAGCSSLVDLATPALFYFGECFDDHRRRGIADECISRYSEKDHNGHD
jgi:hypothetical protein